MSRAELTEFQLRFPHDLSEDGVLAALSAFSGLPHNTRLIFDLSATHDGITHRLAVSSHAADSVTGALRAAVPSLRLDTIESPAPAPARRVVWQLSHATAAIRVDDLAAVSARLLASLFPLGVNESLRLMWKARPARPPRFPVPSSDSRRDIHLSALRMKLALPGLNVYGELSVTAGSKGRTAQLMQRTTPPPPPSAGSAEQVRRASQQHYARRTSDVESNLRAHIRRARPPVAPVGRRRRDQP